MCTEAFSQNPDLVWPIGTPLRLLKVTTKPERQISTNRAICLRCNLQAQVSSTLTMRTSGLFGASMTLENAAPTLGATTRTVKRNARSQALCRKVTVW